MSEMYKGVSFRLLTISVFWAVNTRTFFFILLHDVLPYFFLITSNLRRCIFRNAATYITTLYKIAAKINTLDGKKKPGWIALPRSCNVERNKIHLRDYMHDN